MNFEIGLDIRMLHHSGIGTYLCGLLSGFLKTDILKQVRLGFFGVQGKKGKPEGIRSQPFFSPIYSAWEQMEYPFHLRDCSLWHSPHYNVPILKGKTKLVVTIHDLVHWIFRKEFFNPLQAFYAEKMLTEAVSKADHIITVSQKTKDDLVYHFAADPEKVSVIYEGVADVFRPASEEDVDRVLKKYNLPRHFFLYVGLVKPHKNVLWLLRIFQRLKSEDKLDADFVLVGKIDKKDCETAKLLSKTDARCSIHHLSFLPLEDLVALYTGALALVHPSLYEGFGLTLLEAMACRTPVIAFRSSAIPEVVGEAAYLVEPCAGMEMMEALIRMEKIASIREEFQRRGWLRAQRFSWNQAAIQTAEIYDKVLSQS